jgi:hypothetical protein
MVEKFLYRQKFSYGFIVLALVGIIVIIYSLLKQFSITYKNVLLLQYPYSNYAGIGAGILFLLYPLHKYFYMRAINNTTKLIEVTEANVSFPHISMYKSSMKSFKYVDVNELWLKDDKDDGESVIVFANKTNRYEFFAENFENLTRFSTFKEILQKRCVNITNTK